MICTLCKENKPVKKFDMSFHTGNIFPRCKECRKENLTADTKLYRQNHIYRYKKETSKKRDKHQNLLSELHYIYIVICTKKLCGLYYKIGQANNLIKRLIQLQTGCPFELKLFFWVRFKTKNSAEDAEKEIHLKYKEKHTRGEWFFFTNANGQPQTLLRTKNFLACMHNVIEVSEELKNSITIKYTDEEDRYFISNKP